MNINDLRSSAQSFAELGMPVGPAVKKRIVINEWSQLSGEQFLSKKYNSYWKNATGLGLLCGEPSGVIGLDIDLLLNIDSNKSLLAKIVKEIPPIFSGKEGNPFKRPTQFFRYNGEASRKFQNIHVEILSTGNQTIIPPSLHPDFKKNYSWVGQPLNDIDIDDLPTLPDGFIEHLEQLNDNLKPANQNGEDKSLTAVKGRCKSGSHNKLSALGVALVKNKYDFERLVKRLIKEDRKMNFDADCYYFECPTRKWKHKKMEENAKDFVEEIYKNHGPGGKKEKEPTRTKAKVIQQIIEAPTPPKQQKTPFDDLKSDSEGEIYTRHAYYYRYVSYKKSGDSSVRWIPQYQLMGEEMLERKNMAFDDAENLKFDGKKWEFVSKTALNNFIQVENKEYWRPQHFELFSKAIRSACHISSMNFKDIQGLVNCSNGIIDANTGETIPHSYQYPFKYVLDIDHDPNAEAPEWQKFLNEIFLGKKELIRLVQDMFGYTLLGGDPFLHKAFVLYGTGRNGKSTLLDTLRELIGRDGYSTVSMAKIHKEFSVVAMNGKLANIVEETPTDEINAEVFKAIVGGGEVQASHKGFDEFTLRVEARLIFACNDMPVFKDKSVGLEDRLVFIPFDRYFTENERDTSIKLKLKAELPGILKWALEGAKRVSAGRRMLIPGEAIKTKELYRTEADSVYAWFVANIEIDPAGVGIKTSELYAKYKDYCEQEDLFHKKKNGFGRRLKALIIEKCREKGIKVDPETVGKIRLETAQHRGYYCIFYKS